MEKTIVSTDKLPKAVGPYSQAVIADGTLYASGQVAFVPETGELIKSDIKAATRQTLTNIKNLLESQGLTMENIVKTTVYLADIDDFGAMNEEYAAFFSAEPPARTCFGVGALPLGALCEIEIIAKL